MHVRHALALLALATLAPACIAQESPPLERTGEVETPFDASVFKFGVWVRDDGTDVSGGWQGATASLGFRDTRESILGHSWTCVTTVQLPIRLRNVVISPDRAAQMTAEAADVASSFVMHSQPSWPLAVLFCKQFAAKMEDIFRKVTGGPYGVKVVSR